MKIIYQNPLDWPIDWPRSKRVISGNDRYRKKNSQGKMRPWSVSAASELLLAELNRLGAKSCIISSNLVTRTDGQISGNQPRLNDTGVSVTFEMEGRPLVMANDRYLEPANNIRQLTIALQNLRHLSENGGAVMKERAFRGFSALPAPITAGEPWYVTLGVKPEDDFETVRAAYKRLARQYHSDTEHGDDAKMSAINVAYDDAKKALNN